MDKIHPTVVDKNKALKRQSNPEKWKRNQQKLERYSAKKLPEKPKCTHKKRLECDSLKMNDLNSFHTAFYKNKDKLSQDAFILKHIKGGPTYRRRPRKATRKEKVISTRNVFYTNFNLEFGSPRTDVCSVCLQYAEKIKAARDNRTKTDLMIQLRVHKKRAQAFFNYLKEDSPNVFILSYDCQKNMPLPKIPDQSTYYSRQIYLFNFTIVAGSSKSQLNKDSTFSYVWTEDRFPKDSNCKASAIYHRLNATTFPLQINTVRLMADGWMAGQNKNTTVVGMCQKWFTEAPQHIKKMEIIFPVVGHSFLPADRVFGRIEKEFRKRDTILEPTGYTNIIKEYSSLISVGQEYPVKDWKDAAKKVLKPVGTWHVPFMKCKRFILKRSKITAGNVLVKGEIHYVADTGAYRNVCKKGKYHVRNMINPQECTFYEVQAFYIEAF
ncbi:unnamed protein product [Parnassius mnemosyne]|uniref:DUF7869 domain-containing protein n=1 Tax=Parnassius mnemosyne TaxID=213953 RepID=A0AAV1KJN8_9NEOP